MGAVCSSAASTALESVDKKVVTDLVSSVTTNTAVVSLVSEAYALIKANLPTSWGFSKEEEDAQDSTYSQFATYLAHDPDPKPIYEAELQQLDSLGAVDLNRITRDQWPKNKETNYFVLLSINTYEKENYALGVEVLNDAIKVAQVYKTRGYRVAYLFNSSAKIFYQWVDYFIQEVKKDVTVYFAGIATNIVDFSSNSITQVLAFRDEAKGVDGSGGSGAAQIPAVIGLGTNSVSEEYLQDIVARAAKAELRTVFITNVVNNASVFTENNSTPLLSSSNRGNNKHMVPPYKTLYIQNNSSSAANQHTFSQKFVESAGTANTTFTQLKEKFTTQTYAIDPNGGITVAAYEDALYGQPVIVVIPSEEQELQLEQITPEMLGTDPANVTSLPNTGVYTEPEKEGAEQRWALFVAEMKKSPSYDTKYKDTLKQLDAMGCINLERLNRAQIPNIRIDRVAALFFNPYEDLGHTLGLGPVNDAMTMTNVYINRGYKIVYLMDATPKEFYSWMDWLLSNIRGEILVYFSGHGTQAKDTSGTEEDGLMEELVFYNETKKLGSSVSLADKIMPVSGITDQCVSDQCLHKLITLKDYPDTRIVLMSDCCHSGTMYNFDKPVSVAASRPPLNVVCIGAAKDEQTAKQTVLGGRESGVYTHSLDTVLKDNPDATFVDLESYTKKNIAKYQTINITYTKQDLVSQAIIGPPRYSPDSSAANYSPAVTTESQLQKYISQAKTLIPAGGFRLVKKSKK